MAGVTPGCDRSGLSSWWVTLGQGSVCPCVHPFRGSSTALLLAEDIVGTCWLQGCPLEGQLLNCSKIASFPCFVRKVLHYPSSGLMELFDESAWERGKEKLSRHSSGLWLISALTSDTAAGLTSREGCSAGLYLVILLPLAKD